jgi:hypothetical protein
MQYFNGIQWTSRSVSQVLYRSEMVTAFRVLQVGLRFQGSLLDIKQMPLGDKVEKEVSQSYESYSPVRLNAKPFIPLTIIAIK